MGTGARRGCHKVILYRNRQSVWFRTLWQEWVLLFVPECTGLSQAIRITCPGDAASLRVCVGPWRSCVPHRRYVSTSTVLCDVRASYWAAIKQTAAFWVSVDIGDIERVKALGNANNDWVVRNDCVLSFGVRTEDCPRTLRRPPAGYGPTTWIMDKERPLVTPDELDRLPCTLQRSRDGQGGMPFGSCPGRGYWTDSVRWYAWRTLPKNLLQSLFSGPCQALRCPVSGWLGILQMISSPRAVRVSFLLASSRQERAVIDARLRWSSRRSTRADAVDVQGVVMSRRVTRSRRTRETQVSLCLDLDEQQSRFKPALAF